jgi:hypothetical protein
MNKEQLNYKSSRDDYNSHNQHRRAFGWADVAISALLTLVVSVPTMAVEESWHGHPMIDESTHLWIIAACLVAAAFLAGGVFAGHRRPVAAPKHATVAAGLAVAVLVAADLLRRLWLAHKGVPAGVAELWCLGAVAAFLLSAAGSLLGRRLATNAPHQDAKPRE